MTDVIVWTYVPLWPHAETWGSRGAHIAQVRPGTLAVVRENDDDTTGYAWSVHTGTARTTAEGTEHGFDAARMAAIAAATAPRHLLCQVDERHDHAAAWQIEGNFRRTQQGLKVCDEHLAAGLRLIRSNGCDPLYNAITNFRIKPIP